MNNIAPALKDRGILLGWIAGLVLAASLLWILSFPFRSALLMRSANAALASMEDGRVLASPVSLPFTRQTPLGCWYSLAESGALFFVFTVMRDGILIPCGAEISEQGAVTGIVPLGHHARQAMERIPEGLIHLYVRRIENAVAAEKAIQ